MVVNLLRFRGNNQELTNNFRAVKTTDTDKIKLGESLSKQGIVKAR